MRVSRNVRTMINQDGGILLDIEQDRMISLNLVGSRIWQKLTTNLSHEEIAEEISAEFSIPIDQARDDVKEFVAELCRNNLVTIGS